MMMIHCRDRKLIGNVYKQWRSHGGAQGGTCPPPYSIQGGLRDSCKSEEFFFGGGVGEQIRVSTTAV